MCEAACKRTQQLSTMLGPAVHCGKDTTHKSLYTMHNKRAWPQQCWKSCANGSNIVALRFGDHGTKEMLGVVGWKVWPVSNFAQQHATTCNRVCRRTQHVTSNNVASVCTGLEKHLGHCFVLTTFYGHPATRMTSHSAFQAWIFFYDGI